MRENLVFLNRGCSATFSCGHQLMDEGYFHSLTWAILESSSFLSTQTVIGFQHVTARPPTPTVFAVRDTGYLMQ